MEPVACNASNSELGERPEPGPTHVKTRPSHLPCGVGVWSEASPQLT